MIGLGCLGGLGVDLGAVRGDWVCGWGFKVWHGYCIWLFVVDFRIDLLISI